MKPVVGITSAWSVETWGDSLEHGGYYYIGKSYLDAIEKNEAQAYIITPSYSFSLENKLEDILNSIDCLFLTGGGNARKYTSENLPSLRKQQQKRYDFEKELLLKAYEKDIPVLGICRGFQMMVEVFGGELSEDLVLSHKQKEASHLTSHNIRINKDSLLYNIIGKEEIGVNSLHIQKVKSLPEDFVVSSLSEDGVIESIESKKAKFFMGLQFHPERLIEGKNKWNCLFEKFIDEGRDKND